MSTKAKEGAVMQNKTSQELEEEHRELIEIISIMRWDMRQQADEFDYSLLKSYEQKCQKINDELVSRGWLVI